MSREEMLNEIREKLPAADDYTVEQIYMFLQEVEYWEEVIRISNRNKGGMSEDVMKIFIAEALDRLPPDVLKLIYRITFYSDSGLE